MGFSWNHTYTVRQGSTVVARCCSFKASPWREGPRCTVHKGKLVDPLENTDVVVKAYYDQNSNGDCTEMAAEMMKWNFAKEVMRQCSGPTKEALELVRTLESVVEKEGKGSKLKKKMAKSDHLHHVKEDSHVFIQDFVQGQIQTLFNLVEISAPDCKTHSRTSDSASQQAFLELMQRSYNLSGGNWVIGAAKGVARLDSNGNGRGIFRLTSLTVHSRRQEFGGKDLGDLGVEMYERWNGLNLSPQTPPLPASAPPLELKGSVQESQHQFVWPSSTSQQLGHWGSTIPAATLPGLNSLPVSCMSPMLNSCPPHADSGDAVDFGGPGGHDRPLLVRRQTLEDVLATTPELRSCFPEGLLNLILGPAPAYSCSERSVEDHASMNLNIVTMI